MSDDAPTLFQARGKLLLSSEYVVLDGALALAVPTRRGQEMTVEPAGGPEATWRALDVDGHPWLEAVFSWPDRQLKKATDDVAARRLIGLFEAVAELRPGFLEGKPAPAIETRLEFPRNWGLGTSSTVISLLAQWAEVDPFALLGKTFGGSGYDVACARARGPLFYRLRNGRPHWVEVPFHPPFRDRLYFVYLGKKQDSREGIRRYRERPGPVDPDRLLAFDQWTWQMACSRSLTEWEATVRAHEEALSAMLDLPRARQRYFPDYPGAVKSLGAWGGDFVLATGLESEAATRAYFQEKGFGTILRADELVMW